MLIRSLVIFLLIFISISEPAFAESTEIGNVDNFGQFVSEIWAWASQIIFGVSVVTMIIGGIVLMFAGDDERNIDTAKTIIKGAIFSCILVTFSAVLLKVLHKPTNALNEPPSLSNASKAVSNVIYYLLGITGGIAIIALIVGGFRLISSGGDYEKTRNAKKSVKFAILGLIVALSSFVLLRLVIVPFVT